MITYGGFGKWEIPSHHGCFNTHALIWDDLGYPGTPILDYFRTLPYINVRNNDRNRKKNMEALKTLFNQITARGQGTSSNPSFSRIFHPFSQIPSGNLTGFCACWGPFTIDDLAIYKTWSV